MTEAAREHQRQHTQNREDILELYGLVERVDSKVDALAAQTEAGFAASVERDDALGARIDGVSAQVTGLDSKVTGLDTKVTGLDTKVTGMDTKITGLSAKMDMVLELLGRRG